MRYKVAGRPESNCDIRMQDHRAQQIASRAERHKTYHNSFGSVASLRILSQLDAPQLVEATLAELPRVASHIATQIHK